MSSILEALERAEQERSARETMPLREPQSPPKSLWKQPWVWLIGAGLLLLNLLVWWFMLDNGDAPRNARAPQAQTTVAPRPASELAPPPQLRESPLKAEVRSSPKTIPVPVAQPVVADKPVQVAPAKTARTTVPPLLEVAKIPVPETPVPAVKSAQPTTRQPAVEMPATTVVAASEERVPAMDAPEPLKSPVTPPVVEKRPVAETPKDSVPVQAEEPKVPALEPVVARPVQEVAEEAVEVKVKRIPEIWELPAAAQQKMKDLKITIHVYNEIPAERFVIINMRRYREGDALTRAGLKLESITREGVIINYGEGKVKM